MTKCLILPWVVWEKIRRQAIADWPNECLGMLVGLPDGRVRDAYPIVNASTNPHRFLSDPTSLLAAEKRRRQSGWHLLGFYHSHPGGQALPSTIDTDPEINFWLDGSVVSMIVALRPLNTTTLAPLANNPGITLTAPGGAGMPSTPRPNAPEGSLTPTSQPIQETGAKDRLIETLFPPVVSSAKWAVTDTFAGYQLEMRVYRLYPRRWEPVGLILES